MLLTDKCDKVFGSESFISEFLFQDGYGIRRCWKVGSVGGRRNQAVSPTRWDRPCQPFTLRYIRTGISLSSQK